MKYKVGDKVKVVAVPLGCLPEEAPIGVLGRVIEWFENEEQPYRVESESFTGESRWWFAEGDLELVEELQTVVVDNVNNPNHYASTKIECIVAMEAMLSPEEFIGYLRGNIFKYQWRYKQKNGVEDLKKAQWYQNKLIEKELEKEST